MKKLSVISYLILTQVIYASSQIVDMGAEYLKTKRKFENGEYATVITELQKIIAEVEKVYEDTNAFYEMHNMMGLCYMELNKLQEAEKYLLKSFNYYASQKSGNVHINHYEAAVSLGNLYYNQNKFADAERYFLQSLYLQRSLQGEKNGDYVTLLQNYINTCLAQNKQNIADSSYKVMLSIKASLYGERSFQYAITQKNVADLYKTKGKFKEAEEIYNRIKPIYKDSAGPDSKEHLNILYSLAYIQKNKHQYKELEKTYSEIVAIHENKQNVKSSEYSGVIFELSKALIKQNKFAEALALQKKVLKTHEKSYGTKNEQYANLLMSLAGTYRLMGMYSNAEATYLQSKDIIVQLLGEKNALYAGLLNNLALLYEETGRYDLAEKNLKLSLQITKEIKGENNNDYATSINNLAVLYKYLGKYNEAEPLYKQSLKIRKELLGDMHPDYAASLNNLANFYHDLGRLKEAEPLYLQASQIIKNIYGDKHHEYAISLNNLANLYDETNQINKSQQLLEQSLKILADVLGEQHPEYAFTLNNLAFLYLENQKFAEAEKIYLKDLNIIKSTLGTKHPQYATALSNLAYVYEHMERYADAERKYLDALALRKELLGEKHPDYTATLCNLARTSEALAKINEAYNYWKSAIENYKQEILDFFPSMSEKEKEEFYAKFKNRFEQFNSFAIAHWGKIPSLISDMYDLQLGTKALLLNSANKTKSRIKSSNDPILIDLFEKWQKNKELLAQLYTLPKSEIQINLDSLENSTNEIEKQLSILSEVFRNEQQNYTWKDVQKKLKPNEAAVEIIRFRKYLPYKGGTYKDQQSKSKTDTLEDSYYVALIVLPTTTSHPDTVLFINGADLENRIVRYYSNSIRFKIEDLVSYPTFWQPIKNKLGESKKVFLSPDGIYNQINLQCIYNPNTKKYIIDETDIQIVSNTKDLLDNRIQNFTNKQAILVGDPDFTSIKDPSGERTKLTRLPGTGVEVQKINAMLKAKGWASSMLVGNLSTEENIKTFKDPRILHIATHGFFENFIKENTSNSLTSNTKPLLKSGLYLADGATPGKIPTEDGKLTAYEAMNLSLDHTELVVLSACETGLGKIVNGEGVYGLQRAFIVAGTKSLIFSLWKVNDEATQKLMIYFYDEWLRTNNKREAFRNAQLKLRNEYPSPYFWGAFVMIGE